MLKRLLLLIWPMNCVCCADYDERICRGCRQELTTQITPIEVHKNDGELIIYTGGKYANHYRSLILAWKDHGREDFNTLIQKIMRGVTQLWVVDELKRSRYMHSRTKITVIPAPSSAVSVKRRGKLQTVLLAQAVADELGRQGYRCQIRQLLRQRNAKKQVNFSGNERAANKQNALVVKSRLAAKSRKLPVIVVDDISTTGTTFTACKTALEKSGLNVIGLLSLSSTSV